MIINVGDSRAYLFTAEGVQLSDDGPFSIVEFMVQRGELTGGGKNHPGKNFITRAIGTGATGRGRYLPPGRASGTTVCCFAPTVCRM